MPRTAFPVTSWRGGPGIGRGDGSASGSSVVPNFGALPAAVVGAATAPLTTAYDLLSIPSRSVGYGYADPYTGITIYKGSASGWDGKGGTIIGPDYSKAGRIGRNDGNIYPWLAYNPTGSRCWSVGHFNKATGASTCKMTNEGATIIRNELCAAFSAVTPYILYTYAGNAIHKYDVSGTAFTQISSGFFPKSLAAYTHGETNNAHFGVSADDRWFVIMQGQGGPWVTVWDSLNNAVYESQMNGAGGRPSVDEPTIDADGRYVVIKTQTSCWVWDSVTGVFNQTNGSLQSPTHLSACRGYAFGGESNAADNSRWWNMVTGAGTGATVFDDPVFRHQSQNNCGGYFDQPSSASQYVTHCNSGGGGAGTCLNQAIGIFRLTGGFRRVLCHTYHIPGGDYNSDYPWQSFSPDGLVVGWKSSMNVNGGRQDQFFGLVPTSLV